MTKRTSTIIAGLGRTLITLGCLTLTFAAFQLWGTGLAESRAQDGLENDFETARLAFADFAEQNGLSASEVGQTDDPETVVLTSPEDDPVMETPISQDQAVTPVASVPDELKPQAGDALGVIRIPRIGVDKVVIAGTRRDDLRQGPGHYPSTPLPGQAGNAAIAGHRTTYGAPFGDIDLLVPGDQIVTETFQGTFYYEVLPQTTADGAVSGHAIVSPYDVQVLDDYGDNRLTLTACHPKYSARQRIVVQAKLVNQPAATVDILGLDNTLASQLEDLQLTDEELAYEATGVNPDTAEVDGELDCATCGELDEGNAIGTSADALDDSLGWHMDELTPFLIWSFLTAAAAFLASLAASRFRRLPSYIAASPVVLTLLFISFTHLDRMLPAF
ncbi:MAG: class E sortase [Acidimicrobiales bacterium]|nr:class E sortase [Acidimicrobiales bacterium]